MRISKKEKYSWTIRPLLWLQKKHYGNVLSPSLLWGRKPALFWLVACFFGFLDRKKSPLDSELRSLICVRVSQLNDCAFCIDANAMKLVERTGSEEKAKALANWKTSTLFDDKERLVFTYVEAMTITGQHVEQTLIEGLKNYFDEDSLVELTALIAFQNLSAKFNTALDIPEQGFCSIPEIKKQTGNE